MHVGGEATKYKYMNPMRHNSCTIRTNLPELATRTWLAMAGKRYKTLSCAAVIEQVSAGRTNLTVRNGARAAIWTGLAKLPMS
jgi:hypothetical protein